MSFICNLAAAAAVTVLTVSGAGLYKPVPKISASSCILTEAETGTVLFEQNADARYPSASTVKIMTALVVLEHCNTDEYVDIPKSCVGIEGSSAYLIEGEKLKVYDLLAGMLLSSGNDAAAALACHTAGSVERFCMLMNDKAREIGADNSIFADANGLNDAEQRTTARDLALITAEALKSDVFREIIALKSYSCSGHVFVNHNKLLTRCEGAKGVKTGYTKAAGRALVSLIERSGMELICVTLNDPDDWSDHEALADWAEGSFQKCVVARAGQPIGKIGVVSGTADSVEICAEKSVAAIVPPEFSPNTVLHAPRFIYAPMYKGDMVGRIESDIGSSDIVLSEDVELDESQRLEGIGRIKLGMKRKFYFLRRLYE